MEERLAVFASPERARSLFTVRAAISSARSVDSPRFFALVLMCSYWRSLFGLDPAGMAFLLPGFMSEDGFAAGHRDQCAGDEAGLVGGEQHVRRRDLGGFPRPAERGVL